MTLRRLLSALGLLAVLSLAAPASAFRPLTYYVQACGLTGTAASVVVDVYNAASPGSILATIPNGQVTRIGTTTCYQVNLSTTTAAISFPATGDPAQKTYVLNFRDDAASSVWTSETVSGLPAAEAVSGRCERATPVYATTPIPSRGLTQAVINAGKVSYVKIDVSCAGTWSTPDAQYVEVYVYDALGRVLSRTPQTTVPSP